MKNKKYAAAAVLAIFALGAVSMYYGNRRNREIQLTTGEANASGYVAVTLSPGYLDDMGNRVWVNGDLKRMDVWSDATTAPTTAWDLVLNHGTSVVDILGGAFANIDSSTTVSYRFDPPVELSGTLHLVGTNMGADGGANILMVFE